MKLVSFIITIIRHLTRSQLGAEWLVGLFCLRVHGNIIDCAGECRVVGADSISRVNRKWGRAMNALDLILADTSARKAPPWKRPPTFQTAPPPEDQRFKTVSYGKQFTFKPQNTLSSLSFIQKQHQILPFFEDFLWLVIKYPCYEVITALVVLVCLFVCLKHLVSSALPIFISEKMSTICVISVICHKLSVFTISFSYLFIRSFTSVKLWVVFCLSF